MSEYDLKNLKLNLYTISGFKYPKYLVINSIKITNLNIFSKFISKNKILLYGNYDIIINYKNTIYDNYNSKELVRYKKVFFSKPFYCNTSKLTIYNSLKTDINLLSKPTLIYSLKKYPSSFLWNNNLCQTTLFLSLSIMQYKDTNFNDIDINNNEINKSYQNNDFITAIEDTKTIEDDDSTSLSIIPNTNTNLSNTPSNSLINKLCNINKFPIKKLIEADVILGKGYSELFIEKNITLPDKAPSIWKVHKVNTSADINKIDIIGEKAFADGFTYIDVIYKTLIDADFNTVSGSLQYIHSIYPFSLCIDLVSELNNKFKPSDKCKVSDIHVCEIHKLNNPLSINDQDVYNEFNTQLIVEVTVLVTRSMEIYI